MAKLPYTFTIYPDQPNPKQVTASCPEIIWLLMNSPNGDLTINQHRDFAWDSFHPRAVRSDMSSFIKKKEKPR